MFRNLALWLIIGLVLFVIFNQFNSSSMSSSEIAYSEFISQVEGGYITSATIKGSRITGETESGQKFETYAPTDLEMLPILREHNIKVTAQPDTNLLYMISPILYFVMFILFFFFIMRQMNGGGGNRAFSFGKSKARMLVLDEHKVTFKDVAGVDEAKEELEEVVEFLKDRQKFQKLGGKIPKGVLLVGSPGTGKTLLAKAVAGEAGVAFFSISGSDFVEMFVGVGAARIRDLFEQGKKNAPCIIFMDEIDAVGRHRGAGLGGGHDEREQTLNALLVEMDGFESTQGVILIAATNRPDVLDPALLRPGRFDRQVIVPLPDLKGRRQILAVHAAKVPLADDVNLDLIAKRTSGFSGASLANLVNEAALLAARKNHEKVGTSDFDEARDKVVMGKERRSAVISDKEKEITAYHEAGHAIVAQMLKDAPVVHKVTIIPRGNAGGMTMLMEAEEKHFYSKEFCIDNITVSMGGRAAEYIIYNHLTTGASSDIESATSIARQMVTAWGMSDTVGPLLYGRREGSIFLGKEITSAKDYSEKTAEIIDKEIRDLVESAYQRALEILTDNKQLLEKMKDVLMDKETVGMDEVKALIDAYVDEKWRQAALDKIAALAALEAKSDSLLTDIAKEETHTERETGTDINTENQTGK